ncbi:MAG: OmpA family protein [Burkholderiales bacterium]
MKKTLLLVFATSILWACGGDPPKEDGNKAAVEDRTGKPPATTGTTATPVPSTTVATVTTGAPTGKPGPNILRDPNNILSKRSIFYEYDSDAIKDEYRPMLEAHAKYLAGNPNARMLVQGNTDERGGREYNLSLGQRRAEAVKRLLVLLGARELQVESVSLGEEKPRCEDKTDACFGQNRRSDMLHSGEF